MHFAVDPDEVHMATRLSGNATVFLPLNRGANGGAGNPENPGGGKTAYLWEEVLARDSFLDILARFIHVLAEEKTVGGKKIRKEPMIFPRYHQLDSVRRLVAAARSEGAGKNYLIQHSAGSGKSNSIAWLAHRLGSLYDEQDEKVFDSVIVVTDRLVLDQQLQNTIYQFDHKQGVVQEIDVDSAQLAHALTAGVPVIVTTLQKFPFVTEKMEELPALRYAVIVDEAHSSQGGESATELKGVLAARLIKEDAARYAAEQGLPDYEEDIAQKTEVIVEHFRHFTRHKIGGRAKAMVVTSSRLHAVRYRQAVDKYIAEKGYTGIKALVAFSGTVVAPDLPETEYTETRMNQGIREKELRERFASDEYQLLLVAEKYQTGFDQPLLHTMYVDKRLAGVQAVQSLSRLNRFKPRTSVSPSDHARMNACLDPAAGRFKQLGSDAQEEFRKTLTAFRNLYGFLSQAIPFRDSDLERLYAYVRFLLGKLPRDRGPLYAVADTDLRQAAEANTMENFGYVFRKALEGLFIDRMEQNEEITAPGSRTRKTSATSSPSTCWSRSTSRSTSRRCSSKSWRPGAPGPDVRICVGGSCSTHQ